MAKRVEKPVNEYVERIVEAIRELSGNASILAECCMQKPNFLASLAGATHDDSGMYHRGTQSCGCLQS